MDKLVASNTGIAARVSRQRRAKSEPGRRGSRPIFAIGMPFRKHYPGPAYLLRSIDIDFLLVGVPIFIDGCIWHGCSENISMLKANDRWWAVKLEEKWRCDNYATADLYGGRWRVTRFREHEVQDAVVAAIAQKLKKTNEECANGQD